VTDAAQAIAEHYGLQPDWLGAAADVWRRELRDVPPSHLRGAVRVACERNPLPPSLATIQRLLAQIKKGEIKPPPPVACGHCEDGWVELEIEQKTNARIVRTSYRAACTCELGRTRPVMIWPVYLQRSGVAVHAAYLTDLRGRRKVK